MKQTVIGMDEVGRGALAGPVAVGVVAETGLNVVLPELLQVLRIAKIRDSKKLTRLQRERAFQFLENRIAWAVGEASAEEIDELRLTAAISLAAGRAIKGLQEKTGPIGRVLADAGLRHPFEETMPTQRFIKGDERFLPIAFASIMAKVWRDRLMGEYAQQYPLYGFESHVGYATERHRQALRAHGSSPVHRQFFLRNLS